MLEEVVIIGSGPAGYTAAIYCARANLTPIVITGSLPGGQLTQTSDIENFPGFDDAVNGFDLMMKLQTQAEKFGTRIVFDTVKNLKAKSGGPNTIELESGDSIESKTVVIATGATPRWLGLESEQRLLSKGVSACATCDGAFFRDVPVVVIGGGDTAVEEAIFLTKFASKVIIIHRRDRLRASRIMADRAKSNPKIEILWDHVVEKINGKDDVESVNVINVKTKEKSTIDCKAYFAALGHIPNTKFLNGIDIDNQGFIQLTGKSSYTNVESVFAAGDCADHTYKQAITAAGMGCRAAIDLERWLEANK